MREARLHPSRKPGESATYTYDSNGNMATKVDSTGTTQYLWDFENRLSSVTLPGAGGTVSFKYDPFGRRIEKTSSSTTSIHAYDGDNLIEETNATGAAVARYTQTQRIDEPLAMLRSAATSYYQADALGSVTSLSNTAGALAQTYTFDSFGKQTASSGSLTNPFQYTGRELDSETGLYYMRARYFDPQTGRFLSEDPIGFKGGKNFYAYVGNNAINQTDPDGTGVVDCAKALKAINQAANQVKDDLARVTTHCGCYVVLAAEIALAIEAAEAALAAAGVAAAAAAAA
jgi:RHS repeat-associated protein